MHVTVCVCVCAGVCNGDKMGETGHVISSFSQDASSFTISFSGITWMAWLATCPEPWITNMEPKGIEKEKERQKGKGSAGVCVQEMWEEDRE